MIVVSHNGMDVDIKMASRVYVILFVGGALVLFTLFVFLGGALVLFTLFVFVGGAPPKNTNNVRKTRAIPTNTNNVNKALTPLQTQITNIRQELPYRHKMT